jgi:putative transposase
MKYAHIKSWRQEFTIHLMCRVLDVSVSGFYAWLSRAPSARAVANAQLSLYVRAAHIRNRGTFGNLRLQRDLYKHGITVGDQRLRSIRKQLNLKPKQIKKFKATTNSKHQLPIAPNLLNRGFAVNAPNHAWVSDITYIHTAQGWLYLAGIKDLYSGEIVGYAMNERMTKELVMQALFRAVLTKRPDKGLIYHSDRGSQYCALDFQRLLAQFGMQASMSRKGDCWDNAPMESFWGTLKNELVFHRKYQTRAEAMSDISEYIEIFYNRQRTQKRLGYKSPAEATQQYYRNLKKMA